MSVPLAPRVLDHIDQTGPFKWRDGLLYVAAGAEGLHIIDATDPPNLNLLTTIPTASPASDVAASNGRCYLATSTTGLLYDVNDPTSPQLLAASLPTGIVRMTGPSGPDCFPDFAGYIVGFFDLSNPAEPLPISSFLATAQEYDIPDAIALFGNSHLYPTPTRWRRSCGCASMTSATRRPPSRFPW